MGWIFDHLAGLMAGLEAFSLVAIFGYWMITKPTRFWKNSRGS